jgi:hypothetical protein
MNRADERLSALFTGRGSVARAVHDTVGKILFTNVPGAKDNGLRGQSPYRG